MELEFSHYHSSGYGEEHIADGPTTEKPKTATHVDLYETTRW
jgi:hypothetical protein